MFETEYVATLWARGELGFLSAASTVVVTLVALYYDKR